tara:strand:+ start:279 stop:1085 length:807 start_codon:yes stop_codon:yes gene_type:complete
MKEFNLAKWRQFIIEEASVADGNFGNDIEDRYAYIRPLMSRLPDTARTETLIDFMEDGLREDDKEMFDYGFIEAMKMLGLEDQLMDDGEMEDPGIEDLMPDPALGPNPSFVEEAENEADEIDIEDLEAAADYFDSLAENDDVLDEMLDLEEMEGEVQTESLEGHLLNFQIQAQKIAKQVGTKRPKLVPGKFDSYTMVFPYDQAPGGAMASVGGVETMSAQEEAAAENRANAAALRFIEFLRADGSPVDQGALGVDYTPGKFMVFLAPL